MRLTDDGNLEVDADNGDSFSLNLTVEDLDRHGPGLLLDYTREEEARVLVWTE